MTPGRLEVESRSVAASVGSCGAVAADIKCGPPMSSQGYERVMHDFQACSCSALMCSRSLHLERFAEFMGYEPRVGKSWPPWTRGSERAIGERSSKVRSWKMIFEKSPRGPLSPPLSTRDTRIDTLARGARVSELSGPTIYEFHRDHGKIKIYSSPGHCFLFFITRGPCVLINFPVPRG